MLSQRGELLRDIRRRRAEREQLVPWNLQLVELGVRMIRRRLDLLAFLVPQREGCTLFSLAKRAASM